MTESSVDAWLARIKAATEAMEGSYEQHACDWGGAFDVPPCSEAGTNTLRFFGRPVVWLCNPHFAEHRLFDPLDAESPRPQP